MVILFTTLDYFLESKLCNISHQITVYPDIILLYSYSVSINFHKANKFIIEIAVYSFPWIADGISSSIKVCGVSLARFVSPVSGVIQAVKVIILIVVEITWVTCEKREKNEGEI